MIRTLWPGAPKGRDTIAQGEALGQGVPIALVALKGRDNQAAYLDCSAPLGLRVKLRQPCPQGVALGYHVAPLRGWTHRGYHVAPTPGGTHLGYHIAPLRGWTHLGYHVAPLRGWTHLALAAMTVILFCGSDWLQFRGTDNTSVCGERDLPLCFGPEEHVAWKAPLPGRGPSGPIVVRGRVVVTAASGPRQDRLHVLALDAASGKLRWQRQLWATGSTNCNPFGGVAANTPASDGRRIFALFSSNDLVCFDLDGNLQWLRGLSYECPTARSDAGMASSPLVVGGTVIVQVQNAGESFVAGIDASTGQTRWRIEREQAPIWSSPTVLRGKTPADDLVLLQSRSNFTAHDPATGRLRAVYDHWCDTIASATTWGEHIFLPAAGIHAIGCDRQAGKLTLLWSQPRLRGGESSPVASDGRIYVVKDGSILVCGDTSDGRVVWQLRLKGPIWATPVLAGGHLYAVNHDGLVQTVRLGEKGEVVGTSRIDPGVLASPAVADGAIYFRCQQSLWKISKTSP